MAGYRAHDAARHVSQSFPASRSRHQGCIHGGADPGTAAGDAASPLIRRAGYYYRPARPPKGCGDSKDHAIQPPFLMTMAPDRKGIVWRGSPVLPAVACTTILLAAGLLRWFSSGRVGLWRDEAQFMEIARLPNAGAVVAFLLEHESHPPFYYMLGHVAGKVFGSVQSPMAMLAIAASLLSVYLVYALGVRALTRPAAIMASAATAVSAALIVFSVQLRPYALLTALAL